MELTDNELATDKQMCMFCLMDMEDTIEAQLGQRPNYVKTPEDFGRTTEEYEKYKNVPKSVYEEPLTEVQPANVQPVQSAETGVASALPKDLKQDLEAALKKSSKKEEIQMEALLNEFKGPSTPVTLDVVGSEDFQLSFTIPGHTADNVKAAVHEQMKEFFVDSARFILQSKAYGRYIKDPDAKDQNPMVTLGGQ